MDNFNFDDIEFDDMELDEDEIITDGELVTTDNTSDELEDFSDLETDISDDLSDGAIIDSSELMDDSDGIVEDSDNRENDFISDSGNIVVQDTDDRENGFELRYIDVNKIAVTTRLRKMQSVEDLTQSIKSTGLLTPIIVAPTLTEGLYVLLDGYRRLQACARANKSKVPCVVNNRVNTPEIPILEAMYNHHRKYTIKEMVDYIDFLETQKGIGNPAMIEYLLQMDSGDCTKLKDILNDNDEDIVTKLYDGVYDIQTAFKKLEQRRKKETLEEKENKKAERVYDDEEASGASQIEGSGEASDGQLTEEQRQALDVNLADMEEELEDMSLGDMIEEDKNLEGFKPHKQKTGEREYVDPIIKKTVMTRDKSTCQCCKRGGEQYVDILDYHHKLPVFLGGEDTPENGIMLCVACHRLVHLYSTDDLQVDKALLESSFDDLPDDKKAVYQNEEIFEDEKKRFKRIIILGGMIRKGIVAKGLNKEQFKKEHSNKDIGRRKPGANADQDRT